MKLSGVVGTLTTFSCRRIMFPTKLSHPDPAPAQDGLVFGLHCHVHLSVFGSAAFELIYLFP